MPVSNPANAIPVGVSAIDSDTGDAYAIGLCTPTAISSAGTTTVDTTPGHFFGFNVISLGTSFTMVAYDIQGTSTLQLTPVGTAAAVGFQSTLVPSSVGMRYNGSLVVVTGGTAGQVNALWD